jgi:hypothetical protein
MLSSGGLEVNISATYLHELSLQLHSFDLLPLEKNYELRQEPLYKIATRCEVIIPGVVPRAHRFVVCPAS